MDPKEKEMIRRWVETWKQVGPELEAIRRKEIAEADNRQVLAALEDAFEHAIRTRPPEPTSGMVEMQEIFAKLREPVSR